MSRSLTRVRQRVGAGLIVVLASVLTSCSGDTTGLMGRELFEKTCAVCHGAAAQGSATRPALNAGSNASTLSDEQIRGVIAVGPGVMPSFSRLTQDQVTSLVTYLRELQGGEPLGD